VNRFTGIISSVDKGRLLSRFRLDYHGGMLNALITMRSADELGLKPGMAITALIKSTEMNLAAVA
jgi:molybdate transport system regulatory protein